MKRPIHRRTFLARSGGLAMLAGGFHVNPLRAADSSSPGEKLNIAFVGVANKGWHNVQQLTSENVVAPCERRASAPLDRAAQSFPKATRYQDYRRLLDGSHKDFDAVVVSTADHTHAPATSSVARAGEARVLRKAVDAHGGRSPLDRPAGGEAQGGHADGHTDSCQQ